MSLYKALSDLAVRVGEEQTKVHEILAAAEERLLELAIPVHVHVGMAEGQKLEHDHGTLNVVFTKCGTPVVKSWRECAPDIQVTALCTVRDLMEAVESSAKRLLSDLETAQSFVEDLGLEVRVDRKDALVDAAPSNGKGSEAGFIALEKDQPQQKVGAGCEMDKLIPFRRFSRPKGPVPPISDQKAQKVYCRKLMLWFLTNPLSEVYDSDVDSANSLCRKLGILPSRFFNEKKFVLDKFGYIFGKDGKSVLHTRTEAEIERMFEERFRPVFEDVDAVNVDER